MKNIWILARMTFREAIRRRIVLTGLVLGLIFLTVFNIGFRLVYSQLQRQIHRGCERSPHKCHHQRGVERPGAGWLVRRDLSLRRDGRTARRGHALRGNRLRHHPDHRQQARAPLGCGARQVAGIRHPAGTLFDVDVRWDGAQRLGSIGGYAAERGDGTVADLS